MSSDLSERGLILAPQGRDAVVAASMLGEARIKSDIVADVAQLVAELAKGAGFAVVTEEALEGSPLHALSGWIYSQEEWSDFPFVLLTRRGGGLERNPAAGRYLEVLGNAAFLERPFHPTTLVSLAQSALRGRRRQYEARARLLELNDLARDLERRVEERTAEHEAALAQLHEVQKLETLGQLTGASRTTSTISSRRSRGRWTCCTSNMPGRTRGRRVSWSTRSRPPIARGPWCIAYSALPGAKRCRPRRSTLSG
jgi:DNA-binding response OmpR family regulator